MSDLLKLTDYHGEEFLDRLAGLYRHCQLLAQRAAELTDATSRRIDGMRRHTFDGLSEIGEALLRVQESAPREFGDWFLLNEKRLGFSLAHANRCKAAAKMVREHNPDRAFAISLEKQHERPEAILSDTLRLTKPIELLTHVEREKWRERLRPWAETYHALEKLDPA